ncbi:DUF21 domain-containing protein [Pistricoccus aurantiacus]|uniref:DUF21 domain-containing protein n=1 Tax=Pistricoccus aurantiacus TaxID=1883414 RepID=A0A5B8SQL5_9GAMM|nr:CNNM domain-containing protein [Pistricoccus aurantiacus]QEA38257.1 DUF21 domain-containing protein [Pistricoccus aurantiacus]
MLILAAFALLSIGFSFLCSILEAALLSLTPSYIAQLKESRPKLHQALFQLKADIDRPLAAILTLNTIAHTVGATGVGAQVSVLYGEAHIAVASAVMTLLILVLSEIIPKTIGATYWRSLAPWLPPLLRSMMVLLSPFIWLSELITTRIGKAEQDVDIRSEIKALAQIGRDERALDEDEVRTIVNILNLHEITVESVMTPRTVCEILPPELTVQEFNAHYDKRQFTRFPVMDEGERALGYVHRADIHHADDAQTMKTLVHSVDIILETDDVEGVFTAMLKDRGHMRLVYDEHGAWVGLITLEDVIETILGQDIVDETDSVQNLRRYAKQRWLKRIKRDVSAS